MRRSLFIPGLASLLLLASCASLAVSEKAVGIGPYHALQARLLVIEPTRRWQVLMDWQADSADAGRARLTHAASGTVVELRWQRDDIRLRDNQDPAWRKISTGQLAEQGIVVSPYTLSRFLAGRIPSGFRQTATNSWESRQPGGIIRIRWNPESHRLQLSDVRHGRVATLIILSGELSGTGNTPAEKPHA